MSMKSRARRMLEALVKEDTPTTSGDLQASPQGTQGPGSTPFAKSAGGGNEPQPTDNETGSPELQQLITEHAGSPDQMADMMDQQCKMHERYMDEGDTDVYTPQSPEDKEAVMESMGHMKNAALAMRKIYT
jgi:hypothetical protein